ncbi:hypothetical protein K2173_024962 [Erythroxylum novogranatense]|uniref:Uncharacterized protein n=1 Tax=Erythroxylum novogranatense TaxID=1862640 RepID=A0AAV8UGG1_9ROSI|nr:hypothetical protein K2173_024962 [Erythroxylum novogranatense]
MESKEVEAPLADKTAIKYRRIKSCHSSLVRSIAISYLKTTAVALTTVAAVLFAQLLEAVGVVDRLIELQPNDDEWPLLKGQILSFSGDSESARKIFEDILAKDPLRVEAYHGLMMANSESGEPFNELLKRIEGVMEKCEKEKKSSLLRDFKLLFAQVRVMEEKYGEAIKLYDELLMEEPRDYRPYLCQGMIYTLLKKKDEAEQKFDQFRKLVPKDHPYRKYILDNMFANKFFSENS